MPKPKLFVSHSTTDLDDTARAKIIKGRLHDSLKGHWDVFLDERSIAAGTLYRPAILAEVARSQAAVILLTNKALDESFWVPAETTIFCFRKTRDPQFQLVPVLFDGIPLDDPRLDKYDPFQLREVKVVHDGGGSLTTLLNEIISEFDPQKVPSQDLDRWVVDLLAHLGDVIPERLHRLAEEFGIDVGNIVDTSAETCAVLRRAIAIRMHHATPLACTDAIGLISPAELRDALGVSQHVKSLWVETSAAEQMLRAMRDRETSGLLTLNAKNVQQTEQYLHRSLLEFGRRNKFIKITVSAGGGDTDSSRIQHVVETLQERLNQPSLSHDDGRPMTIEEAVATRLAPERGCVAICSVPPSLATVPVLKNLRQRFPRITFLVEVGAAAEDLNRFDELQAVPLRPPLTEEKCRELQQLEFEWANYLQN